MERPRPRPFWLQVGRSGFRVTDENRDALSLGLLLGLELESQEDSPQ